MKAHVNQVEFMSRMGAKIPSFFKAIITQKKMEQRRKYIVKSFFVDKFLPLNLPKELDYE